MRILIADDHAIFRHGLKDILARTIPGVVFGEASTTAETIQAVQEKPWDIVVLDIGLPDASGAEALKAIKQIRPDTPVLVLSMYPEEQYALQMIRAGAAGYLTKVKAPGELVNAVAQVRTSGFYVSGWLAQRFAGQFGSGPEHREPHERLSRRESQIMQMTASGKTSKEIASTLSVSIQTVSTHRGNILRKMGLRTTAEVVRYAVQHGLVG